ncbi:sigma-54 interaction domain-containing protein [Priestia megaterium]|uniref:sigma-54 interaction domain-containing protein n=1 Tax=Priestia megaterium TaxID=1404 RepID=UPI00366A8502
MHINPTQGYVARLEKERAELQQIFNLSLDEIFVTNGEGVCIKVNPICEKNTGYSVDQLVGKNVNDLVAEGIFTPSATLKVLKEKEPVTVIQSTSNGKRLHVTSTPVFNEEGELDLVISNTIDITEVLMLKEKVKEMEYLIETYNNKISQLQNEENLYGHKIIARSSVMIKILELLGRVAKVDSTVLLLGESGVGKTEIAKWIHEESSRKKQNFIEINCATIPPSLFESELFGYEPGAFTGALKSGSKGLIELANNGTLFLDEIGELSLDLQTKLLQVIQHKSFMRVGGRERKEVDVRIIVATNRDLEEMVRVGKFREDLFYRLSVIPVNIPPLRERREELIELIFSFLDRINQNYNCNKVLSPQLLDELVYYDWPGNIRELENTLERLVVTTNGTLIDKEFNVGYSNKSNLLDALKVKVNHENYLTNKIFDDDNMSLNTKLEMVEKQILESFLKKLGSTRKVAKALKSSQSTISRKCIKYGIKTTQK